MPTYVYKFVDSGETIEVQQAFHDDALTEIAHPDSGELLPVKKVFTPVGVTFKGSGFFKTDNRGKSPSSSSSSSDAGSKAAGSTSDSSSSKGSSTTDTSSSSSSGSSGSGATTSSSSSGSSSSGSSSSGSSSDS